MEAAEWLFQEANTGKGRKERQHQKSGQEPAQEGKSLNQ
jgi:hypothetical protein